MTFNIKEKFGRRDGREILWWHLVGGNMNHIVYGYEVNGYTAYTHVSPEGVELGEDGSTLGSNNGGDLINASKYQWANVYREPDLFANWYESKQAANAGVVPGRVGYLRRPRGSLDVTEWDLLPLDTEVE